MPIESGAMIREGENTLDGIPFSVCRRRVRRLGIRIDAYGRIEVCVPLRGVALKTAGDFLHSKWEWVVKTRTKALQRAPDPPVVLAAAERAEFAAVMEALTRQWCDKLGEGPVTVKVRALKSIWGSCQWRKRLVTYNTELSARPFEQRQYVAVHEITHLRVHDHGTGFCALMDARLPGWRRLRRELNSPRRPTPAQDVAKTNTENCGSIPVKLVQGEFW